MILTEVHLAIHLVHLKINNVCVCVCMCVSFSSAFILLVPQKKAWLIHSKP